MSAETVARDPLRPEPEESARQAGLTYVTDGMAGIRRKRWGRGFTYLSPEGEHVQDEERRARFEALAIPPAWEEVWICPEADGHIQAMGRDEQGRKQYIYHPRWREVRNESKFHRMLVFGEALPTLRERVEGDLRRRSLSREKVLAAVARLLETTLIRVGNREYARNNGHFGLTTLRDKHVAVAGSTVRFTFEGKSGKQHEIDLRDRRLARIVKQCREVPGYDLFQYYDESGARHGVASGDVNEYLREATGLDFTAKDFRTWGGSVLAAATLRDLGPCADEGDATKNITEAIRAVAEHLGNTPAVCREFYVHPGVLDCYLDHSMHDLLSRDRDDIPDGLHGDEQGLMRLLRCWSEG